MATYVLTIAGSTKTLREGSLNISETVNGRNLMRFDLVAATGSYRPTLGDQVLLTENGTYIFGGNITAATEQWLGTKNWAGIVTRCTATDFNALADRRVVTATIPSGSLKAALQVLDDYLTDYSVTLDAAQVTGPTLPDISFENRPLTECFNELAELTDYTWEIDYTKTLRMTSPGSTAAPFNVVDGDGHAIGDVSAEPTRENYANAVVVKGGSGQREVTETFTGDGVTTDFDLSYTLVAHRGYITNAGGFETLGTGATWDYSTTGGVTTITRTSAPTNGNTIEITYTAQFPVVVTADTSPAAADRVERIFEYPDTFDVDVLQALADSLVLRLSATRRIVKYTTFATGVHPGQTQTIQIANRNLNATCMVTDVVISDFAGNRAQRSVTAIEGTAFQGSWRDIVKGWSGGGTSAGVTSVSGTFVINSSGTFPGDVIANFDTHTTPSFESGLIGSHGNASVDGPAMRLGRTVDNWTWYLVANTLRGSTPGNAASLEFVSGKDSSSFRRAMSLAQADTPVSGEYYLLPSVTGKMFLGAPSGTFTGFSGAARWENLFVNTGIYEANRSVKMSEWTDVSYNAGDFVANGGDTWAVAAGDVNTFQYKRENNGITVNLTLDFTSITSGTATVLSVTIPAGLTATKQIAVPCIIYNNTTTAFEIGLAQVFAAGTTIQIIRTSSAAFSAATNNTFIRICGMAFQAS